MALIWFQLAVVGVIVALYAPRYFRAPLRFTEASARALFEAEPHRANVNEVWVSRAREAAFGNAGERILIVYPCNHKPVVVSLPKPLVQAARRRGQEVILDVGDWEADNLIIGFSEPEWPPGTWP